LLERKWVTGTVEAGWLLLVAGGVILAYTGNAEPYLSASQLPGGESANPAPYMAGLGVGLGVGGLLVSALLKGDQWGAMTEETGLAADGGGLLGTPDLTGTVGGRPVRARRVSHKTNRGTEGSNRKRFTIVETQLANPARESVMITRFPEGSEPSKTDLGGAAVGNTAIDGRFAVTGGAGEGLAEELLTGRVRNLLVDLDDVGSLTVGDPTEQIMEQIPDVSDSMVGRFFEGQLEGSLAERSPGEANTVAIQTAGTLRDGAELQRRLDAVVAVADAYEARRGQQH
jgi:hypothetical protein